MSSVQNQIFYPNVTAIPGRGEGAPSGRAGKSSQTSEFSKILSDSLHADPAHGLQQEALKMPLRFSNHAMERLNSRNITIDPERMERLSRAIDKAEQKGVIDSLVLMDDAALIVSVKNRTVVTAMDRNALSGNVFTNIDGAVIV